MIDYISGTLVEINPTSVVIDNHGIGYDMEISLQTYQELQGKETAKVYIHHHLREDMEQYFGFSSKNERTLFRQIISVSGIGVGSARMMLSSMSSDELRDAILTEDINKIKGVKGIGLKSAQRLVIELKDKVEKNEDGTDHILFKASNSEVEEAVKALTMLGFAKPNINKAIQSILKSNPAANLEEIIKMALKIL